MALAALDFLRRKNVAVPKDISVVGFDDSIEPLETGLTSYNFNIPELVEAVIRHILRPADPLLSSKALGIEGAVIARNSTRLSVSQQDSTA